jgi:hypothetical protein
MPAPISILPIDVAVAVWKWSLPRPLRGRRSFSQQWGATGGPSNAKVA